MTTKTMIPVVFPSRPTELPAQMTITNGEISVIKTSIDAVPVRFVKDSNDWFKSEPGDTVDTAYFGNIEI